MSFKNQEQIDIIGIGDMVTDTFIELENAWIEDDNPEHKRELCMKFGDKLPYKDSVIVPAVGNAINASVSASRLGLKTAVISNTGDDEYAKESLEVLQKENVGTEYITTHPNSKSNCNFILRFKEERTILVHHREYEYQFPANLTPPKYFYLSSLAQNSIDYHNQIVEYLEKNPQTKLIFQPGTFQMKLGYEKLKHLYELSDMFFCNKEEAEKILNIKDEKILDLLKMLHALGPRLVVITDGPNGAYVYDGEEAWHGPMYPDPAPPVDRTGAGDAFASTFVSAIILGHDVKTALSWAPINSMSVVQYVGSREGLLTESEIKKFLEQADPNYKAQKIN